MITEKLILTLAAVMAGVLTLLLLYALGRRAISAMLSRRLESRVGEGTTVRLKFPQSGVVG